MQLTKLVWGFGMWAAVLAGQAQASDQGHGTVKFNKSLDILYQHPSTLEAVPVKDPGMDELGEGAFSATATLLAEYL